MNVISLPAKSPALPLSVDGIDVNFCKNPTCPNFGVPAKIVKYRRTHGTSLATSPGTAYMLGAAGKNRPVIQCLLCKESLSVKSSQAVADELTRFGRYLQPRPPVCCGAPDCPNHAVPVETQSAYYRYGMTAAGTPRYRCCLCNKTVAAGVKR